MALVYADRVKETSTTTGTGTYTLAGAVTGFQSFAAIGNGNTCYYVATDGTNWEVGIGTYTSSGTTLARTSVLASTNANAAVSWAAGTRTIFCDAPASLVSILARTDQAQSFTGKQTFNDIVEFVSTATFDAPLDISGAFAGQIKFPASQNASSNANTLDDYEEGTFTPAITGTGTAGAGTYTTQSGKYVKVGALVFFDIVLVWTAHTGTTGMKVTGLPFTSGALAAPCALYVSNLTFAATYPEAEVAASTTEITLSTVATGGAAAVLAMDTAATLHVSGCYSVV